MDDDELERELRAGLERRAGRAEVDHTVVERARRAARGRRTTWAVAGASAAAVVVVAAGSAVLGQGEPTVEVLDDRVPPTRSVSSGVAEYRTEHWRDLQVEVPADWGYGAAPQGTVGNALTCFPGASLDAAGTPLGPDAGSELPYVGRPIGSSDMCVPYPDNRPDAPATDYVWLGAAVAPGVVELDDGLVQETVERDGTTITVATADAGLRRQILDSVTGGERCLSEVERSGPIAHDRAEDPDAEPVTLRVCAYRLPDVTAGPWELTYAADLGGRALSAYLAAVGAGDPPADQCPAIDYQLASAVVLEVLDADGGVLRQDAVNPMQACAGIAVDATVVWELETTRLTPAMTEPWVVGGVGAVVSGDPALGFIGPQG